MKSLLPLLALVVALASCSTAYKTGQTPDDVYYSPARPQEEYVRTESNNRNNRYRYDEENYDDRYLRMKVRNRRMWNDLDFYYSDPYAYNYYNRYYYNNFYFNPFYNTPWNGYNSWNYYYNPYTYNPYYYNPYGYKGGAIIVTPQTPVYNRPRQYNLHVFDNPQNNTVSPKAPARRTQSYGDDYVQPRNSAPRRDAGEGLRREFGNSSSNNSSAPARSEAPGKSNSSSSSSGSGGSSGGNAPVRKF